MTSTTTPVVLVTQNEGNVVDLYQFIQGVGRIIFIDWDEVSTRMADYRHGDMRWDASEWADDIQFLRPFAEGNLSVRLTVDSWDDLCEEYDFDPDTGLPN